MAFFFITLGLLLCLLLGVLIGAAAVVFHLVNMEIAKKKKNTKLPEFYVNMVVTNKNDIINAQVDEHNSKHKAKDKKKKGRKFHINVNPMNFGVGAVEKTVAHAAVSDDKFMVQLSDQVAAGMKDKFSPQKIDASGEGE